MRKQYNVVCIRINIAGAISSIIKCECLKICETKLFQFFNGRLRESGGSSKGGSSTALPGRCQVCSKHTRPWSKSWTSRLAEGLLAQHEITLERTSKVRLTTKLIVKPNCTSRTGETPSTIRGLLYELNQISVLGGCLTPPLEA